MFLFRIFLVSILLFTASCFISVEKVYDDRLSERRLSEISTHLIDDLTEIHLPSPKNVLYLAFDRSMLDDPSGVSVEWTIDGKKYTRELDTEDLDMRGYESRVFSTPLVLGEPHDDITLRLISTHPIDPRQVSLITSDTISTHSRLVLGLRERVVADPQIVTRSEWGADEEYRYADSASWKAIYEKWASSPAKTPTEAELKAAEETRARESYLSTTYPDTNQYITVKRSENNRPLVWPIQKTRQVNKIIIHHTAENLDQDADDQTLLRAIYRYHAISRGWGDIGYNYIIGQRGQIYEGRAGGDYVVGAHAMWNNAGSVGISVMGNFENTHLNRDQRAGLETAIEYFARKYGITISTRLQSFRAGKTGTIPFLISQTPSLLGHRDVGFYGYTACPGAHIYSQLPSLLAKFSQVYTPVMNPVMGPIDPAPVTPKPVTQTVSIRRSSSPLPSPPVSTLSTGGDIRVRLSYPSDRREITIGSATAQGARVSLDRRKLLLPRGKNVTLSLLPSGQIQIQIGARKYTGKTLQVQGELLRIVSWDRVPSWDTQGKYNDNLFRSRLDISAEDGVLTVVNQLPLEYYLKGMGEVSEGDAQSLAEKSKAIIVAARSYVLYYRDPKLAPEMRKFPWKSYHLSDNPDEAQKYLGYSYEMRSPTVSRLVDATHREVIWYADRVVKVWYSSSTDGQTRSYLEYCQSRGVSSCQDIPYLRSVADPGSVGFARNGHGVGISGRGSSYFAAQGWNYKQIIEYYMTGVTVGKRG